MLFGNAIFVERMLPTPRQQNYPRVAVAPSCPLATVLEDSNLRLPSMQNTNFPAHLIEMSLYGIILIVLPFTLYQCHTKTLYYRLTYKFCFMTSVDLLNHYF